MFCKRQYMALFFILRYGLVRGTLCNITLTNRCLDVAGYCYNGGTCYYDKNDCRTRCLCDPMYRGRRCEWTIALQPTLLPGKTSPRDTSKSPNEKGTLTSSSGTATSSGETSTNLSGTATSNNGTATSHSGTATSHSGKSSSYSRTTTSHSGTTTLHSGTTTSYSGTITSRSGKATSQGTTATSTRERDVTSMRLARHARSVSDADLSHVCSPDYTMRPRRERNCLDIFLCVYGYCHIDQNSSFQCICDYGGVGVECGDKCCLPCSEHGICEQFPNGTERCHCDTNYEGRFCDKTMKFEEPESEAATSSDGIFLSSMGRTSSQGGKRSPGSTTTSFNDKTTSHSDTTTSHSDVITSHSGITTSHSDTTTSHSDVITSHSGITTSHSGTTTSHSDAAKVTLIPDLDPTSVVKPSKLHVCSSNYTMRPYEERKCIALFCVYGYCQGNQNSSFQCICDYGGVGTECEHKCCLPCSEHGICEKFPNGTERCHCDTNYEGRFCEIKAKFDGPDSDFELLPFWVIPIVLGILILAAVVLFFWMWKNRVTLIMKIVHYFQAYEDDDEKIWDVFISYKSADIDQNFVLHVLLPKLEELGFTVCLHFREFVPGEPIANNIINAINKSRRTILILTPRYVTSEFTRMEYQVAQLEMLKRKHKIVPVLLEDISTVHDTMDPNLKHILRCVTYLEYPGPDTADKNIKRFWEKLSLAMPKKRRTDEKQQKCDISDEQYIEGQANGPTTIEDVVDSHV